MSTGRPRKPERVGALLTAAVPELAPCLVADRIRREWAAAVGAQAARHSRPADWRRGVLHVTVDSSPWLQELHLRTPQILSALAARHPGAVTGLRLDLGQLPTPERQDMRPRAPRRRDTLTAGETELIRTATAAVRDPDVASALRRLMTTAHLASRSPR
jgi:hypothetical protein